MISPMTPPGTKVICIDDANEPKYISSHYENWRRWRNEERISAGAVYTVACVDHCKYSADGFIVRLVERPSKKHGYSLARFRLPITLDSLTAVPSEAPVDLDRRKAPAPVKERA